MGTKKDNFFELAFIFLKFRNVMYLQVTLKRQKSQGWGKFVILSIDLDQYERIAAAKHDEMICSASVSL